MDTSTRRPRITSRDEPRVPGWGAPTAILDGDATSSSGSPDDFSLWLVRGELGPGATLRWDDAHGDEVLYVERGELRVDDRTCPEGGAIVLEAGIGAEVTTDRGAAVLHFGPADPTPPGDGHHGGSAPGQAIHIVGPRGTWAQVEHARDTRYFADSTCPTCRATLLFTGREGAYESPAHSHSQDELIHVLHGEIQLGARSAHPGDTIAIGKGVRYMFRSPSPGFAFLNYRRDASLMTTDRHAPPFLEGGEVHGFDPVMDLR